MNQLSLGALQIFGNRPSNSNSNVRHSFIAGITFRHQNHV